MLRFCFAVLAYPALIIAGIWLVVRAAGTVYALPVFFLVCSAFYLHDAALRLGERRKRRASQAESFARVHERRRANDIVLRWFFAWVLLSAPVVAVIYLPTRWAAATGMVCGYSLRSVWLAFGEPFQQRRGEYDRAVARAPEGR